MKNTRICPKCARNRILRVEGEIRGDGAGNFIKTGLTFLSAVRIHRYVCCSCGYSEEWIDPEDIEKLEEKYGIIF